MNEQEATDLFNNRVLPAFKLEYPNIDVPYFFVDNSADIDGTGGVGIVGLTQGACQQSDYFVRFAIAHETAHGVVYREHEKQGTHCPQAEGISRKKHEAWADLIATKVLIDWLPDLWASVHANIDLMPNILGPAVETHPSGATRVRLMKEFVTAYSQAGIPASPGFFSMLLCCFGKRPVGTAQAKRDAFEAAFRKIETANL